MLFKMLDRRTWKESVHNPVKTLEEIPQSRLEIAAGDPEYLRLYDRVIEQFFAEMNENNPWFSGAVSDPRCLPIAYFSAEYGLHHSLPFYAGGLGFLAGDFLKECSDLGIPLVAVGFMYPEGYTRQRIREDGWQLNIDDLLDRESAPITRVLGDDARQMVIEVPFVKPAIHVAVWRAMVGRIPLYLMDTDIRENDPWNRAISSHLYGGDIEQRLRQEIVLGIGGSEVLARLGVRHSIAHLNEGHAAFVLLERIRERVQGGMGYQDAVASVKKTTVFTTHTPVAAGHDVFPFALMEKYFGDYYPLLGLSRDDFLKLGIHPEKSHIGFNMTAFALRMSDYHNAVSKRHGEVSRAMWKVLWPDSLEENVPIRAITNGVHIPTWVEPRVERLLDTYLGNDWIRHHDDPKTWEKIRTIPDRELWETHYWLKLKLINSIRERVRLSWKNDGISPAITVSEGTLLDPAVLTIGFARRFTAYKRADLIFTDFTRLARLLNDRWRPIQIIFAGKSHPADDEGKRILQRVFSFARSVDTAGRVAFVENYDEQLAQYLVHGVDVWLNNPLPPMEACGTSGMKAGLNGVPHLSIRDGWWIEGYTGKNGWSFGNGNTDDRNRSDADALYSVIENEIIPRFYSVEDDGIPHQWVNIMKESMVSVPPYFSTRRMAKEYVNLFYGNALKNLHS